MVTWKYLCPFKIDRKANCAPFAISEWLCSIFFSQLFPLNEFIWNQIKIFMSPLPISSVHGFWVGGVDCGFKGLEALECEL